MAEDNEQSGAGQGKSKSEQTDATTKSNGGAKQMETGGQDAVTLLKSDHRTVEALFEQFEKSTRRAEKAKLAQQICQELIIHAQIEEEIFYPACREHMDDSMLDEAQVEHDGAKTLINELLLGSPEDPFYDAKVKVLSEQIKHHVQEEEKRADGIFVKAKAGGLDMDALGQKLMERKAELMERAKTQGLERPRPRAFKALNRINTEEQMAQSSYRDRDERGRFMSDDDYDDRRSSRSRSRYEDDDDDRRSSSRGQDRERDEYGRFMSDDDRRGGRGGGGGRSRYDDDDRRGGGRSQSMRGGSRSDDDDRRGRGGWFGDPEGHSEASRRGWRNSDHEGSGWYGDSEGHSEASRRGWRNSDHEGSGWYGDPEGHSEASRRGWESRSGSSRSRMRDDDDDDRRGGRGGGGRSQSMRGRRDDDDDDRGGRGGQGGWFGDSRGHSEAARRGWENRR